MMAMPPPYLSPLALVPVALGRNVLPLIAATTAGGAWILWFDRHAWSRRGHPILGPTWRGWRLVASDVLVHWVPLSLCIWWTLAGRPVDVWLSAAIGLGYLAAVGGPRGIEAVYRIERGGPAVLLAAAAFVAVVAVVASKNHVNTARRSGGAGRPCPSSVP